MKRTNLIVLFVLFGLMLQAQQRPQYTQYILNNYILNPALSGIENYTDVKISGRELLLHHLKFLEKTQEEEPIGNLILLPSPIVASGLLL